MQNLDIPAVGQQNRIKRFRELRNYTQEHMALQMNISQNAYSRIESGQTKITIDRLNQIAEVLEVPFWELLENQQSIVNFISNKKAGYSYIENFNQSQKDIYDDTIKLLKEEIIQLREEKKQLMELLMKAKTY